LHNPGTPLQQRIPAAVTPSPTMVTESQLADVRPELISTCVTPSKVSRVQQILASESERHKCTLKLLPYFFTREELANSNTDGTHGKDCLDGTKLNALKVLVFTKFPANSQSEKDKVWRDLKGRRNAKCRSSKFFNRRGHKDIRSL